LSVTAPTLLHSVTVVDTRTGTVTPDRDVILRVGLVAEIAPAAEAPAFDRDGIVVDAAGEGADFIKFGMVTPQVLFPAQAEAQRLDIPILGHLPPGIDVSAAARSGFKSIEHLGPGATILADCSPDRDALHQAIAARPTITLARIKIPFMGRVVAHIIRNGVVNPVNRSRPEDIAIWPGPSTHSMKTGLASWLPCSPKPAPGARPPSSENARSSYATLRSSAMARTSPTCPQRRSRPGLRRPGPSRVSPPKPGRPSGPATTSCSGSPKSSTTIESGKMGGQPCIRGHRFTVEHC
jgi:hypothetical protein